MLKNKKGFTLIEIVIVIVIIAILTVLMQEGYLADICIIYAMISFLAVFLISALGIVIGGIAGFYGGVVDNIIMRICDILMCLPTLPLMLIIGTVLDSNQVPSEYYIYLLKLL